jgi:hypothetical protein
MKKMLLIIIATLFGVIICEDPQVLDIAEQMHNLAPQCQILSPEEMMAVRKKIP